MSLTTRRTAAGQSVQGGLEGSSTVARFHATISPTAKPSFKTSRPSGALADTSVTLMTEHSEAEVKNDNLILAELVHFLASGIGDRATAPVGGLWRYRFVVPTYTVPSVETLHFTRGTAQRAEAMTGVVTNSLTLTVNGNNSEASLSASLLGEALNTAGDMGAATQSISVAGGPSSGAFQLSVLGATTGDIPFDATAAQVQAALDAALGAGFTVCTGDTVDNGAVVVTFAGATGAVPAATFTDTFDVGIVIVSVIHDGTPPAELPVETIQPGQVAVYVGATRPTLDGAADVNAGTGYTPQSYDWSLSDLFTENHVLDASGASPAAFLPNVGRKSEVKVWVDGNDAGVGLIGGYRVGTRLYVTATATTTGGARLTIHTAVQVSDVDNLGEESGAFGYTVTFTPVHEEAWNGSQLIEVITAAKLA